MELTETTFSAFQDELTKISAGMSRIGRMPISASKLLSRGSTSRPPGGAAFSAGGERFVKKNFLSKVSAGYGNKALLTAAVSGVVGGHIGIKKAKKEMDNWKMGRELSRQQQGM